MSSISRIPRKLSHCIKNKNDDNLDINIENSINENKEKIKIPNLLLPLKEHQKYSIKWMCDIENKINDVSNMYNIKGGILSDAPGLGKTLTTLCLCIKQSIDNNQSETGYPNLIICPKIIIDEWCNCITKFFGDKYIFIALKNTNVKNMTVDELKKYKFVITNYEFINSVMKETFNEKLKEKEIKLRMPVNEELLKDKKGKELLININWNRIVCDESHRLNNSSSITFLSLINLISNKRWCLTGTPIRNYEKDIYHQFLFLGYNNFIGRKRFTYNQYRADKLYKYILKRGYKDVNIEMPDFEEKYIYIELTENEKEFYKNINECLKTAYKQFSNGYASFSNVLHLFLRLRQMCVSSFAMVRQFQKLNYNKDKSDENLDENEIFKDVFDKLIPKKFEEWVSNKYGSAGYMSSKISAIINILEKINCNEKILIYTCFKTHMDIIKEAIESKLNENVLILNGDFKEEERQHILNDFKNDKEHNIMIINYKLGSEGLNLMEANNVILCENWWCPSVMEQAKHRAYRIGQKRKVNIYNIITKDTIEEKIKKICEKKEMIGKCFLNDAFDTYTQKDYKLNSTMLKKIIF